jgi:hypothetical protein
LTQSGRIAIEQEHLKEELGLARALIQSAGLGEIFASIDRGHYGFTVQGLRLLEVLETALSVFIEVSKQLTNLLCRAQGEGFARMRDLSGNDVRFINLFGLFAASVEAMEGCAALSRSAVRVSGTFRLDEVKEMVFTDTSILPRKLLDDYQAYLKFYRDHGNPARRVGSIDALVDCSTGYFKLLKNSIGEIASDSIFTPHRESLEGTGVSILGKAYDGFRYSALDFSENSELMPVSVQDIIGNQDYLKAALRLSRDVAGFDFSTWQNPKVINPVLFALGSPGCGKTVTAHAVGNHFLDFCREHSIRSRFVIIRRTDWASSYQNASANQLIDIFRRNVLEFKGVVGIYWPDIDTAFAAREDSGTRGEEKNILGAVFGLFDGTILPKNGQWFMMCDANYLNMDKATISRITQDPYSVKGPEKPGDFVALFRDVKLKKHREFLDVTDAQWEQFGQMCLDDGLSGRSVENTARKAVTLIEDFDFPPGYYQSDLAGKREMIRNLSRHLTFDDLKKLAENYLRFEKEAEEKSARQRFDDRVKEIVNYMSAQKAARETLLDAGQL